MFTFWCSTRWPVVIVIIIVIIIHAVSGPETPHAHAHAHSGTSETISGSDRWKHPGSVGPSSVWISVSVIIVVIGVVVYLVIVMVYLSTLSTFGVHYLRLLLLIAG